MTQETEQDILARNVRDGDIAQKAYDMYIKRFISDSIARVNDAFGELKIDDADGLLKLKLMHSSIKALEANILGDIESRNLAAKQLGEDDD